MDRLVYSAATENDIPFICETYTENMEQLHGIPRSIETWKTLLAEEGSAYYIVRREVPLAWFRTDLEEGGFWLGMLQVKPEHHRKGIGKFVLSVAEAMAREAGFRNIGIHTTQDNTAARALYLSAGYTVTEVGPCTTADGAERVGYTFQKDI